MEDGESDDDSGFHMYTPRNTPRTLKGTSPRVTNLINFRECNVQEDIASTCASTPDRAIHNTWAIRDTTSTASRKGEKVKYLLQMLADAQEEMNIQQSISKEETASKHRIILELRGQLDQLQWEAEGLRLEKDALEAKLALSTREVDGTRQLMEILANAQCLRGVASLCGSWRANL